MYKIKIDVITGERSVSFNNAINLLDYHKQLTIVNKAIKDLNLANDELAICKYDFKTNSNEITADLVGVIIRKKDYIQ